MHDQFDRNINYLRLSVTEACNFRCAYCSPSGHYPSAAPPLSLGEIEQVVRAAVALGIVNVRLTGGEPLLRRDIVEIVQAIVSIEGVRDLSITTNGYRLAALAQPLKDAGLARVNVSLDTLRRKRFARIVGQDSFDRVWRGIESAEAAGLVPLKINVVTLRGVNDDEVIDFARLTLERDWHVRFIELMPIAGEEYSDLLGVANAKLSCRRVQAERNSEIQPAPVTAAGVDTDVAAREFFTRHFISAAEIKARIEGLEPIESPHGNGPARTYRLPQGRGTLGFITPASQHFCAACNRIRVTSQGMALPCLFSERGMDLRAGLEDIEHAQRALASAIAAKPQTHPFGDEFALAGAMRSIGG